MVAQGHFPPVEVSVVVAAITRSEAEELANNDEVLCRYLEQYAMLSKNDLDEWLLHYGESPEQWRPFFFSADADQQPTVETLVWQAFDAFNQSNPNGSSLVPVFRGLDFVSEEPAILIIDSLSLLDAALLRQVSDSGKTTQLRTQTIILNPIDLTFLEIHREIEGVVREGLAHFYRGYLEKFWDHCEFGDGRLSSTQRWFHNRLRSVSAFYSEPHVSDEMRRTTRRHFGSVPSGNGRVWAEHVRGGGYS